MWEPRSPAPAPRPRAGAPGPLRHRRDRALGSHPRLVAAAAFIISAMCRSGMSWLACNSSSSTIRTHRRRPQAGPQTGDRHLTTRSAAARATSRHVGERRQPSSSRPRSLKESSAVWDEPSACRWPKARPNRHAEEREQQFRQISRSARRPKALSTSSRQRSTDVFAPLQRRASSTSCRRDTTPTTETISVHPVGTEQKAFRRSAGERRAHRKAPPRNCKSH